MTEPTDAEIIALADETRTGEPGREGYILPISFARAVLAKWGQPSQAAEPVTYQYQSKDGTWHEFIDQRHHDNTVADGRFPIRTLYTAPQPVGHKPLTHAQAKALVSKYGNDPLHLVLQVERHHGIKGGQHG